MRLPAGYAAGVAAWSDLDDVVEIVKAADLADAGVVDPVREHVESDWKSSAMILERDTMLVRAPDGRPAGYASVGGFHPDAKLETWVRVHPAHRGVGLGTALLERAEGLALERSPDLPLLQASISSGDDAAREILERRGYVFARTFWHMVRELEPPIGRPGPLDGVEFRPYQGAMDLRTTYDVLEESFLDHWGYQPYPYDEHVREMDEYDRDLALVAVADRRIVAASFARLVEGSGWVDVVGVLPGWRRRGIGRGLLARLFAALAERRAPQVMLNVDSENATGAPTLYISVGMRVHRAWNVFERRSPGR